MLKSATVVAKPKLFSYVPLEQSFASEVFHVLKAISSIYR